jgi:hypothetical protein
LGRLGLGSGEYVSRVEKALIPSAIPCPDIWVRSGISEITAPLISSLTGGVSRLLGSDLRGSAATARAV